MDIKVASFTDAWIETIRIKPEFGLRFVASFTDAWIETSTVLRNSVREAHVASFTDAWIETSYCA